MPSMVLIERLDPEKEGGERKVFADMAQGLLSSFSRLPCAIDKQTIGVPSEEDQERGPREEVTKATEEESKDKWCRRSITLTKLDRKD